MILDELILILELLELLIVCRGATTCAAAAVLHLKQEFPQQSGIHVVYLPRHEHGVIAIGFAGAGQRAHGDNQANCYKDSLHFDSSR